MNYMVRIGDNGYRVLKSLETLSEAAAATLEYQKVYGGTVIMREGATGRRHSVRDLLDAGDKR